MGDPLEPEQGPFLSFLQWLDRPGQVVRNLIHGNPGGAGRQALDFLGEIPDAFLPGNAIPDATTRDDYVSPHELVGMSDDAPWYERVPTDIGLGILTDPLSLIGVGELNAGIKGASAIGREVAQQAPRAGLKVGVPFVPSLQKTFDVGADIDPFRNAGNIYDAAVPDVAKDWLAPVGRTIRSTFGAERLSPEAQALRDQARAAGMSVGRAGNAGIEDALAGATAEDRANMVRVIRNIRETPGGDWEELLGHSDPRNPIYDIAKQSAENDPINVGPFSSPADTMLKVRDERMVDPALSPLDESVGLGGVVDYPGVPFLTSHEVNPRPTAMWADQAADLTRAEAYPPELSPELYASGVDIANRSVLGSSGPRIQKVAADAARRIEEGPQQGGDIDRLAKSVAKGVPGWESSDDWITDPLTGGMTRPRASAPAVELPSDVTDRLNEMMGGPKSENVRQSVTSAPPTTSRFDYLDNQINRWNQRVDALGLPEADANRLKALLVKRLGVVHNQYKESIQDFPGFYKPIGRDIEREMPADYAQGRYELPDDNEINPDFLLPKGSPSALKEKSLFLGADTADYLNKTGAKPVLDIAEIDAGRASQQAHIAQKATIGRGLVNQWAAIAKGKKAAGGTLTEGEQAASEAEGKALAKHEGDTGASLDAATKAILKEMAEKGGEQGKEDAAVLGAVYNGLPPRSAPMALLAKVTKPWKAAVVFGLGVPKVGSLFRNRLSGGPQVASTPGAEAALGAMGNPLNVAKDVIGAVMEGMGMEGKGAVFDDLRQIESAYKGAGGRASNAVKALRDAGREDLAGAVENGVLDSFTSAEKLKSDIEKTGWRKWVQKVMESPARMFGAVEHSMRLQTYQKILEGGKSPAEAAKLTSRALYDYGSTSVANRTARDIVPFFQFQAKAIPQQAQWLAREPAVGVASAQVFGNDDDETIYPYLAEHAGFSLGHNPDGTLGYVGGFGLPEEALSNIPGFDGGARGFGRGIERGVVASANPLLKAAYSTVTGRDPYFGTQSFSYDKVPFLGHEGAAGRFYNGMVNSGLGPLAGIHGALQQAQAATGGPEHDRGPGITALDLFTGANVVDVDQDRALQQILQNKLALDPNIQHYDTLYSGAHDDETQALLDAYHAQQKRIKAKRKNAE